MTDQHLTMAQLLAVRDGDRSQADFASAHAHVERCPDCRGELDRLHQRTARLRAMTRLEPDTDQFPAVMSRLAADRRQVRHRVVGFVGLAAAAALAITVVGADLVAPPTLDASEQLRTAITRSQFLERTLSEYNPEQRVLDGRTIELIIQLEDRIAAVDARLQDVVHLDRSKRVAAEVSLWQERVGLMSALVDVHLTKATNVDL